MKTSRIKYVVISVILLVTAIAILIFMLWAKGGAEAGADDGGADNLYSASRFFCRVKYPDNWDISAGDNGFYMNRDTGLIFQIYPFTTEDVAIETVSGATQPPTTPEPLKIPTEDVLVSVYYREAPDFSWPEEEQEPVFSDSVTPKPTATPAPYSLEAASDAAVAELENKLLPEQHEMTGNSTYTGQNCRFTVYTYRYTNGDGELIQGEMSVCSRAMAYYMIIFEAREDLYGTYYKDYQGMVDHFILSVFDY